MYDLKSFEINLNIYRPCDIEKQSTNAQDKTAHDINYRVVKTDQCAMRQGLYFFCYY